MLLIVYLAEISRVSQIKQASKYYNIDFDLLLLWWISLSKSTQCLVLWPWPASV